MFEVRKVVLGPGTDRAYEADEWRDSLVVVETGEIELESLHGARCSFVRGDVLWLAGLHLRRLRNRGRVPAVLTATSRANSFPRLRV